MNSVFIKKVNDLKLNKNVFKPNLTTFLSYSVEKKKIQKNPKVLDLGCGNGVIGILLFKEKKLEKYMLQMLVKMHLKMQFIIIKKLN